MSEPASFADTVLVTGMSIATPWGALELDWQNLEKLSEMLAAAI